jgi:hypothetical protein
MPVRSSTHATPRVTEASQGRQFEHAKVTPVTPAASVARPSAEVRKVVNPATPGFVKPSDVQSAIAKGDIVPVDASLKSIRKDDAKGPKPENVNALRNALSSVLKDVKTAEENKKPIPESKHETVQPKSVQNHQPQKPNEVPEDVLKKILDTGQ